MKLLLVGLGGAGGSMLRFWLGGWAAAKTGAPWWGTLFVNVTGAFAIGALAAALRERDDLRHLLIIGLLGGYTTFSAFSLQTFELVQKGHGTLALANVALSVILCLLGVWLGTLAARYFS